MIRRPPRSTLFPYTRSSDLDRHSVALTDTSMSACATSSPDGTKWQGVALNGSPVTLSMENAVCCVRSEEHTSELQSHLNLVCRLLLEKKKEQTFGTRLECHI